MKQEMLEKLAKLQADLKDLRQQVTKLAGDRVSKAAPRQLADAIATRWVEDLRSPLEHKFQIPAKTIEEISAGMKRLHIVSRPNNRKKSYLDATKQLLHKFEDRLVLPIKQAAFDDAEEPDLESVIPGLGDDAESEYLREAIDAANAGFVRAAIVLGWCAAIDRIQRKVLSLGLGTFNKASQALKAQTSGKFKRWNKEFSVSTMSELQTVFDTDLIVVMEGMELIDGNQAARLEVCFQYRNHSAHPGEAPIGKPHLVAFFSDIAQIILRNPKLDLASS